MGSADTFDDLVAEGLTAPVEGWGFGWFDGRASEQRPPWRYARQLAARMQAADSALDLQTGGGEVLSEIDRPPRLLVATEGWPPNIAVAHANLRPLGGQVVRAADAGPLPFAAASFDLVAARHPVVTPWGEIARVLRPGGRFFSQQVGAGSLHELTEALMGPQPVHDSRSPRRAVAAATRAGLEVVAVEQARLRTVFYDVAAVIAFLRKVIWIVPGFDVEQYRTQLLRLHESIGRDGSFPCTAARFLIDARKA